MNKGPFSMLGVSTAVLGKSWSMSCRDAFDLCASSVRNIEIAVHNRDSGI